jgi:hypothetical protein
VSTARQRTGAATNENQIPSPSDVQAGLPLVARPRHCLGRIVDWAAVLNVDLDQHIEFCIEAMKQGAAELGLAGTASQVATQP